MQNIFKVNQRNIGIYRESDVWLRLAEALNNGGFPRMAYAILATGISKEVVDDSVSVYCNDADYGIPQRIEYDQQLFQYIQDA